MLLVGLPTGRTDAMSDDDDLTHYMKAVSRGQNRIADLERQLAEANAALVEAVKGLTAIAQHSGGNEKAGCRFSRNEARATLIRIKGSRP